MRSGREFFLVDKNEVDKSGMIQDYAYSVFPRGGCESEHINVASSSAQTMTLGTYLR